jgi:ankyrin repeat protein
MKFLLSKGASLDALGPYYGLSTACFQGHGRLCQFLIERSADAFDASNGELAHNRVLQVLLANGANPNCVSRKSAVTDKYMRDVRTRGETPLHRAAAFCDDEAIQMLIDAEAKIDAKEWRLAANLGRARMGAGIDPEKTAPW